MDASGFARDCHGGSRHSAGQRIDLSAQAGGFAASRARKSRDLGPHQGPDRQVSATDLLRKSFPLVRPDTKLCGNVVSVQAVVGLGHLQTFGESLGGRPLYSRKRTTPRGSFRPQVSEAAAGRWLDPSPFTAVGKPRHDVRQIGATDSPHGLTAPQTAAPSK